MAVAKVILNGNTLIDTTDKTVASSNLLYSNTALGADGEVVTGDVVLENSIINASYLTSQSTTIEDGWLGTQIFKEITQTLTDQSLVAYSTTRPNLMQCYFSSFTGYTHYKVYGQFELKWANNDTEIYTININDWNYNGSLNSYCDIPFTWSGSGRSQTFNRMSLLLSSGQYIGVYLYASENITDTVTWTSNNYLSLYTVNCDGYESVTINFDNDPRFLNIYQSLAYRSKIASSAPYVGEWCNSLSNFTAQQFAGQPFSGDFTFNNIPFVTYYAFGSVYTGTQAGAASYFGLNFPSCLSIFTAAFVSNLYLQSVFFPKCTSIGNSAFQGCNRLVTMSFPECVTISSQAFYDCSSLTTISFPKCTSIGNSAFQNCASLVTASFPECTYIGASTFATCKSLTTISFPKCAYIGGYAFQNCSSLTTISFPECISIGTSVFQGCSNLTTVSFPECITISSYAFNNCKNLATIFFPECTTINNYVFTNCTSLTTISFPKCTSIGNYAFSSCSNLVTISFPECTVISINAFQGCSNLTTISFPECITISSQAFYNCYNLTTMSFPKCTTIGSSAFYNCSNLTTISFSECTSIGTNAFYNCKELESAYFMGSSIPSIGTYIFINTPIANSTYLGYFGSIYVPSSLLASYKTTTNWATYSARMVGI